MGEILRVRLRLIACAVGRRCLLIADGSRGAEGGVLLIILLLVLRFERIVLDSNRENE
jgi:hypothetical protein